ncbi:Gfo/Idh/MocA family oxidoreductase [Flavihumibacter fluvii]|uniref:Gfo/Idh/MocA family oxidoreductase n=1 Tax=Flavihumibacter fluvii TaxID=2838157 RepID=UPI001BDF3A48|nr:Gfo/Idh/MocA family oxidoreductase [Flavihumibacter fluvii]ULQ52187.1 Gfo/Idh/MocA family oxidoreductase [Flavihumibacter fluvii]
MKINFTGGPLLTGDSRRVKKYTFGAYKTFVMSPIKTGICSFGMSGKLFHGPFIDNHPGFELAGIVERHRDESREKYPHAKIYRSFEALIADPSMELIVVNTPVQTHFDYVKAALLAGKKVIAEKPFTVNAAEAEELDRLAKETNGFLSVYQNRRYDGDFGALKNIVQQGVLGELVEVQIRYDRYRVDPSGKEHKEGSLPGAGNLHDLGSHLIDQALQLFGWPKALFADICIMREGVLANDYFELILMYGKMRVRLKASLVARAQYPGYILNGMLGSFMQERSDLQEQQLLANVKPTLENWCPALTQPDGFLHATVNGQEVKQATTSTSGNYMNYYNDVYKAITGQAPNPVPASDAVKTMRIIDAAFKSAAEKRVIDLV